MRTTEFQERRTPRGVIGGLVGLVAMSGVAGLLIAASVTPVVALSGLAVTDTINTFQSLPEFLSIDRLSQKSNIYAMRGDGSPYLLASFYDQNRIEVGSDSISPFVTDAAVSSEDPRFYEHGGIDMQGTIRAGLRVSLGGETQGGSSITQQYVKNVLVQKCEVLSDPVARDSCYTTATRTSAERKLKEMRLAIGVEKKYSKKDILRQYLNITGFGGTVYGIEAAAEYYFNTTAAAVSLPQAASLVAIINNPVKFQLDDPNSASNGTANGYAANRDRRDYILGTMLKYGTIGPDDYAAAVAAPVEPSIHEPSTGCQTAGGSAYFCDYVTHVLRNDPAFGADADTRLLNFRRGGYNVYTTIDLDLQNAAEATMKQNVPSTFPGWDVGAVISSVQVGTGRVLAMVQNKDYSQDPVVEATGANYTSINYNTDYADGGSSGFQPGSGYKVFTLAEWLTEGHALYERVDSRRKANWGTFQDSCLGPQNYDKEKWNPKNDANESGAHYSALEATVGSINTGYIGMAKKLDLCGIRKTAEAFRMHRADATPLLQSAASVIGTNEIAPLSMAVAFAGIANRGVTCSPVVIDRIVGPTGAEVPVPTSECAASVNPTVAAGMAYAMHKVMTTGTGQQSNRGMAPQVPVIGKTGTTDGNKDTWMTGSSTKVATVVAVVSLTGDANQRTTYFDSGQAATARHRMWPAVMSVANAKYGGDDFIEANPTPTQTPRPTPAQTQTPTPR
ncbi:MULTISPECIES: transglycosylase domain-containing protein [unclassified Cryobacterium]|uniref:transglycosylase domain-containing protein n=2 Tax=Cryobacterium TaxID=69578 RepID=UPI001068FD4C|nr:MULTISPECIES: transglycosylase domain-containing protein [unclassified Cryobacterium]MDY7527379.1 transglycosylase domain-containing protein [Cryobacterium sp. 10C2]MEB0004218.1 transglycosylase domain-containing protein [Cryobacterium sp. RTC2.1]MEB0202319.1 transglycosylase domain-containing protein [Cryobacterium sp. 5I3]MEB0286496.1 transglycosylase domain-containing protein [Cryobacterium sp. 10S3]MEB0292309.1 transglycosylase domain-containing protein [Cryobacterium sp. 10C2]